MGHFTAVYNQNGEFFDFPFAAAVFAILLAHALALRVYETNRKALIAQAPLAVFMVNFVRKLAKMLQGRFPGRLEKLIVFPVPKAALSVFHAMQWVFHAELNERIVLVPGSAERKSPLPKKYLQRYISEEVLDYTEQKRIDTFVTE